MNTNKKYTLLVVEDNELNRELLDCMLNEEYKLLFAENGEEGMTLMREHYKDVDVMLLDIEMPVMNGYEVLEAKAKEALIRDIPVVITTSANGQDEEVKCLELGATDFVRKPYDPVVVRLRINSILRLRESTEANRQKAIFIQNISHEIRTPMNAIMGFSQFLGDAGMELGEDERSMYFKFITSNSLTLMGMIDNMIVLSDFDSGSFSIAKDEVSINDVCRGAMEAAEYSFPEDVNVHFTSDIDDGTLVNTDAKHVQQALVNYITNACKFTAAGEVHVHCSDKERAGYLTISVTDTGIGVPADKADYVFERFAKIDEFVPGIGLGLSISRKIARILDGEAYLDTKYEGGARFVLELPEEK